MKIDKRKGYIEIKADDGKALKIEDNIFHGGAFPLDCDISKIEEIDEPTPQGEDDERDFE